MAILVFGIVVVALFLCTSPFTYGFPRMITYHIESVEGFKDGIIFHPDTGVQTVFNERKAHLRLFGEELSNEVSVALTTNDASKGDNCGSLDHWAVSDMYNVNEDGTEAELTVIVPDFIPHQIYRFCFGKQKVWEHQGTKPWQSISGQLVPVKKTFLPFWLQIIVIFTFLCCSGLFSGLNLGLMALDKTELQILENSGSDSEKMFAKKVRKVRQRGNYLLCTILLGNVLVNTSLTILMDDMTGSAPIAIFSATMGIVIFGEIVPQAFCSRYGLAVGAKTVWFVWFFLVLTFPISFPISKVLDCILGKEMGNVYNRDRLRELLKVTQGDLDLVHDEVNIITGALELSKKTALDVMTKLEDVYMMSISCILNFETMTDIVKSGFTRIPVFEHERTNIVGLLNVKDLAFVDPDDQIRLQTVCKFYNRPMSFVFGDTKLDKLLTEFKEGRCHMSMVQVVNCDGPGDPFYEVVGLVTLEDVLEEIIQAEIMDETDVITDNRKKVRRKLVDRDFSVFQIPNDSNCEHMSPQLSLAAFQFLSTSLPPFGTQYVSENILQRLLKQNIIMNYRPNSSPPEQAWLYKKGQTCDYFTLILEGHVEVTVGKENLEYEAGPFTYFGLHALGEELCHSQSCTSINTLSDISNSRPCNYQPDFSVVAKSTLQYLRIRRVYYMAARRATLIEHHQIVSNGGSPTSQSTVRIAEEAFSKEIQKVIEAESILAVNRNIMVMDRMFTQSGIDNQRHLTASDSNITYTHSNETLA